MAKHINKQDGDVKNVYSFIPDTYCKRTLHADEQSHWQMQEGTSDLT